MRSTNIANNLVQVDAVELAVGIVEHLAVRDAEDFAGLGKLGTPQLGQFLVCSCRSAIARSRTGGQADHRGLDTTLSIEQQRAAKGTGLVVRMSGNTEQFAHKWLD